MATLGDQLRAAREARGATASEAAMATRMKVQAIEALEANDYSRVAAPTYAKGFIRLYAEYLGLESAPLIQLYEEHYMPRTRAPILAESSESSEPAAEAGSGEPLVDWAAVSDGLKTALKSGWTAARPYAPWAVGTVAVLIVLGLAMRSCGGDRDERPDGIEAASSVPPDSGPLIEESPTPYLDLYLR